MLYVDANDIILVSTENVITEPLVTLINDGTVVESTLATIE